MAEKKYLDSNGLLYLWSKIKSAFVGQDTYSTDKTTLETSIATNTSDISTLKTGLASTDSNVSTLQDTVSTNTTNISTLTTNLSENYYDKDEVDSKVASVTSGVTYKGTVDTYADLPTSNNALGDLWNVATADDANGVKAGDNVIWNGTTWDVLSGTIDLSAYQLSEELVAISNSEIDTVVAS